jgi:hypothetical protein
MALEQYSFGAGRLYMLPYGIVAPQPVQVGTIQETSVDFDWSEKVLQGSRDAAAAIARGGLKVSGKVKNAKLRMADISSVIFGTTPAQGLTIAVDNEGLPTGLSIPASVTLPTSAATASGSVLPFTSTAGVVVGQTVSNANIAAGTVVQSIVANTSVTLSNPITAAISSGSQIVFGPSISVVNAATFVDDLGVINVNTGVQLTPVVSAPTTGQYSVSKGVYTFAAADAGNQVSISYEYTKSTVGSSFTYYAQQMGPRPTFKMVLSNAGFMNNPNYAGQPFGLTLWNAGISKFSLDFKNEDWNIPESDFSAAADFMNRVFTMGADS